MLKAADSDLISTVWKGDQAWGLKAMEKSWNMPT
jgi:hypothetical protein